MQIALFQKKIHTHPTLTEGHQKFLGGGGSESQTFEAKYAAKLEFPCGGGGGGGAKQKNLLWGRGSMDIFWNCTFHFCYYSCNRS